MAKFKHIRTGAIISSDTFFNLGEYEQSKYTEISDSGNSTEKFLVSAAIGAVTGSAILGGVLGGDLLGGVVGDSLDGDLWD